MQAVRDKRAQVLLLLTSKFSHLLLEVMIMPDDGVFLTSERLVAIILLALDLCSFES